MNYFCPIEERHIFENSQSLMKKKKTNIVFVFLGCTELCWVDAVLYSAAVHAKLNSEKEIGERTRSWFQRCQSSIQVVN